MWRAVRDGNEPEISRLAEQGVNINTADKNGWTAVHLSALHGRHRCVALLHRLGADVNKAKHGFTPMRIAAQNGHLQCIQELYKFGADVRVPWNGTTPAQIAEKEGHTECAELIRRLEDMPINKPEPVYDPKDYK